MTVSLPHSAQGTYRLAVGSFYFLQGLVFASWASRIPDIKQALHLNDAQLGSLLLALPIGQLTAMGISGYLVSRCGSRKMLSIAGVCYPLSLVLLGVAGNAFWLGAALLLFGMTANLCNISVNTQGVGVERLYKGSIMASFHGLWSLAGFAGGLISAGLARYHVPPFAHFCGILVLSWLILFAMGRFLLPRDARPKDTPGPKGRRFRLPEKLIAMLGCIAFSSMVCEGTMFDWSGVYFAQVVKPEPDLVGFGYVAFMSTMACGRFTVDRLVNRFGVIPVLRLSGMVIAVGLLVAVLFPYFSTAIFGFLLVGFGVSSIVPLCYSLSGKSKTTHPGVAVASVSTIGFLGFLMGPPLIGFIAQASSLRWSFALIALLGLMTSILAPRLRKLM